jgi:hypothetical protein
MPPHVPPADLNNFKAGLVRRMAELGMDVSTQAQQVPVHYVAARSFAYHASLALAAADSAFGRPAQFLFVVLPNGALPLPPAAAAQAPCHQCRHSAALGRGRLAGRLVGAH